ncbi:hypothetical protein CMI37_37555 [Candidatus Pacearchaeota archaeon]|nr:hypothetical protein [Candidatus Pacearchaeota archaeon]|tara:strand:+ start:347 stop:535 length:189 start_codon:yes stop_codon:yes gene_type:complete
MTREEEIERFIAENKNNRKKYQKLSSGRDKYEKNRKALDEGRAVWLWNGKKWVITSVKIPDK